MPGAHHAPVQAPGLLLLTEGEGYSPHRLPDKSLLQPFSVWHTESRILFFFNSLLNQVELVPVSSGMWHSRLQSLHHQDSPAPATETTQLCCPALGSPSSFAAKGKLGLMEINLPTTASEEFAHLLHTANQTGVWPLFLNSPRTLSPSQKAGAGYRVTSE